MDLIKLYKSKFEGLNLEDRIYIKIIEIAVLMDFIVSFLNVFVSPLPSIILNIVFFIVFVFFYYIALCKKYIKLAILAFKITIPILFCFAWFVNHGVLGDVGVYFISMTIVFSIISSGKTKILVPILIILMVNILMVLEFYNPQWVVKYTNPTYHKLNMVLSMCLNVLFSYHIVRMLKNEYEKNNIKLKEVTKDLSEKNKILEANESKLHSQNENLQQLNQSKNRLFSLISHDLRSPLAGIQGLVELAYKGDFPAEQIKELLPEMHQSLSYTVSLLDNLLFWSKSQLYSYEPEIKELDIAETIRKYFLPNLQIMAKDKQIKVALNFQIHHALGMMDYNILEIVSRNISSNAIKFSPIQSEIHIVLEDNEKHLALKFIDQGVGMNSHHIDKIYKGVLFTTKGTSNEKGVGIGLNLCQELLQKCNSSLEIQSEMGKGTTVIIKIPKATSHKKAITSY